MEIGSQVVRLKVGDKVVVPFTIWCGECDQCARGNFSVCQNSNRKMGQTHVNRWADDLLRRVLEGEIDTTFMITHRGTLEDGPELYRTFRDKKDGCVKVVLTP